RLLGHEVEIHEAGSEPGGMMRFGIPTFRLPRHILDAEIDRLLSLGITLKLNTRVNDLDRAMRDGHFYAAFLAIGAQLSHRAYVPAGQAARVLDALSVLGDAASGQRPKLGRTVVVYGGGNTAMDVARTARRLGAEDAIVVYRRTQAQMPANPIEVEEAVEEGVQLKWLRTITQVDNGAMTLEKMELDEHGKPQPTGVYEQLAGDAVILALGQDVDRSLLEKVPGVQIVDGVVSVDATMMTGHPGIFAGGDLVPSARSVTVGIGHGKTAAGHIDRWLRRAAGRADVNGPEGDARQPVAFGAMNAWYYSDAPHVMRPRLDGARRTADFAEVVGGLDADTALYEARRCMSCGNCFGCDNCLGVCPDNAVRLIDGAHGYAFDYDYCKGCGLCAAECPCGAIVMEPERT
ncbi:MAG TPA: FAD-dependent oxidoreductase, partial [Micromonosporaceae bacterium]|nr:FAD-dependent oxidoreductase [Micromonosporaceae bacterium]